MIGSIGSSTSFSISGMQNRSRPKPPDAEQRMSELDSDGSGSINTEEFAKIAEKHGGMSAEKLEEMFAETDSDGDGEITEAELEEFHKNRKPKGMKPPQAGDSDFLSQLKSAVESDDDSSISSLLEQLKSGVGYSAQSSQFSATSMLLDLQA